MPWVCQLNDAIDHVGVGDDGLQDVIPRSRHAAGLFGGFRCRVSNADDAAIINGDPAAVVFLIDLEAVLRQPLDVGFACESSWRHMRGSFTFDGLKAPTVSY